MTVHRTALHRIPAPAARRPLPVAGRHLRPADPLRSRFASDRGDVPGWVMITLMTAAIVVALWAVASDQIVAVFENAMAPFLQGL